MNQEQKNRLFRSEVSAFGTEVTISEFTGTTVGLGRGPGRVLQRRIA